MIKDLYRNTSATIAIGAVLAISPMQIANPSYFNQQEAPMIIYKEESLTPKLIEMKKPNWIDESNNLLNGIREFTEEEAKLHEESIFTMFKSTGRNIFDLL